MENLNLEIKGKILSFLKTGSSSSSEIAENIGHNRQTVAKYLEIMKTHKLLHCHDIAQTKLWGLSERQKGYTILVADEDKYIVEFIKLTLEQSGYRVIEAYSGLDALDKINKEVPDLVIVDQLLPGINGCEICRNMKGCAHTQHIPVVMLYSKDHRDRCRDVAADNLISKPFDPAELVARINTIIRRGAKDHILNPLTGLPGKGAFMRELRRQLLRKDPFMFYNFHLSGLRNFKLEYGFRKGDEMLTLFSRILIEKTKGDERRFVAHLSNDVFVAITNTPKLKAEVSSALRKVMPFFSGAKPKAKIMLKIRGTSASQLRHLKNVEDYLRRNSLL